MFVCLSVSYFVRIFFSLTSFSFYLIHISFFFVWTQTRHWLYSVSNRLDSVQYNWRKWTRWLTFPYFRINQRHRAHRRHRPSTLSHHCRITLRYLIFFSNLFLCQLLKLNEVLKRVDGIRQVLVIVVVVFFCFFVFFLVAIMFAIVVYKYKQN